MTGRVHGQDLRRAGVYKYNRLRCGGADREPHIVMNARSWGRNIIKLGGRQCSCERNSEQVEPQVGNRLATFRQYLSDLLPVWAQLRLALRLSTFIYNSSEKLRVYHLSLTRFPQKNNSVESFGRSRRVVSGVWPRLGLNHIQCYITGDLSTKNTTGYSLFMILYSLKQGHFTNNGLVVLYRELTCQFNQWCDQCSIGKSTYLIK